MSRSASLPARFWHDPVHVLAFGFGAGAMPMAPGTWGSLVAIPFYFLLQALPWLFYGLAVAVAFVLGIFLCAKTARDLGVHDHGGIVWDEIVGMWITLWAAPPEWWWIVLGFALFRLFDVWKPFPIRWLDRHVSGGLGIMLDDLVAGVFAALSLLGIYSLWTQNF